MNILDELESAAGGSGKTVVAQVENAVSGSAIADDITKGLTGSPVVQQNRARLAVVVDTTYRIYDTYKEYQWYIFAFSILGLGGSLWMLRKRWESPEARAVWIAGAAASAGMAWFARPTPPEPPVQPGSGGTQATATPAFIQWLDGLVAARTQASPGWEANAWHRLTSDLGYAPLPATVNTLLTRNSK